MDRSEVLTQRFSEMLGSELKAKTFNYWASTDLVSKLLGVAECSLIASKLDLDWPFFDEKSLLKRQSPLHWHYLGDRFLISTKKFPNKNVFKNGCDKLSVQIWSRNHSNHPKVTWYKLKATRYPNFNEEASHRLAKFGNTEKVMTTTFN